MFDSNVRARALSVGRIGWIFVLTFCFVLPAVTRGEDPADVLPADERVGDVLSPSEYYGFAIGSRHLRHDQIVAYWNYLATASDRVELIEYAKSHGQRPLRVLAISSAENITNLEEIQRSRPRLTSGRFGGN
ncbi:MAG: hypothetical protein AAGG44_13190, partial [Planctomycetota bacterium]